MLLPTLFRSFIVRDAINYLVRPNERKIPKKKIRKLQRFEHSKLSCTFSFTLAKSFVFFIRLDFNHFEKMDGIMCSANVIEMLSGKCKLSIGKKTTLQITVRLYANLQLVIGQMLDRKTCTANDKPQKWLFVLCDSHKWAIMFWFVCFYFSTAICFFVSIFTM